MRLIATILIIVLLHSPVLGQINTSFSFGSLGSENNANSQFTGPIVIDGRNECLTLQNGLNPMIKENSTGIFKMGCNPKTDRGFISFNIFPNPSKDHIIIKSNQFHMLEEMVIINLQDIRGALIFHEKISADLLNVGFRMDTKQLPNGLYLIKAYSNNQYYTYKFIKTGNLQ
jgi:hypothetical protein